MEKEDYYQDSEVVDMEINQNRKEIKVMIKACLYGSFLLLSVYLLFVILKAIGVFL